MYDRLDLAVAHTSAQYWFIDRDTTANMANSESSIPCARPALTVIHFAAYRTLPTELY